MPCCRSLLRYSWAANCTPRTPFYVSSGDLGLIDRPLPPRDEGVNLAGDVGFEAADRLQLGVTFGDAAGDVGLGPWVRPQSPDGDDVQRAVGRPIATAVEAM